MNEYYDRRANVTHDVDFSDLEWEEQVSAAHSQGSHSRNQPLNLTAQIENYLRSSF
jgi:hypothetical protein